MSEENKTASVDAGSAIDNHLEGGSVSPSEDGKLGKQTEKKIHQKMKLQYPKLNIKSLKKNLDHKAKS